MAKVLYEGVCKCVRLNAAWSAEKHAAPFLWITGLRRRLLIAMRTYAKCIRMYSERVYL